MDGKIAKKLYFEMLRIRTAEEGVANEYAKQQMRCPVHLSIGQEAVPVGISAHLSQHDKVYSNHRCHAHYLAKGGTIAGMIAELHCKATGCAKGKGGSMHLVDIDKGMMGSSALVGGTIPLAVGSAFSQKLQGGSNVSVTYFGDGGSEEGIFYESLNFAALHRLPVLFICENNSYATYSHQSARQATPDIYRRAESFKLPGIQADGNDVEQVFAVADEAIARARNGEGPTLIEFLTYRWRDHVGPNFDIPVGYRTQDELDAWMEKCPIRKLQTSMQMANQLGSEEESQMKTQIANEVRLAFEKALTDPLPHPDEVFTDVYA